jgi:hypothetical protein
MLLQVCPWVPKQGLRPSRKLQGTLPHNFRFWFTCTFVPKMPPLQGTDTSDLPLHASACFSACLKHSMQVLNGIEQDRPVCDVSVGIGAEPPPTPYSSPDSKRTMGRPSFGGKPRGFLGFGNRLGRDAGSEAGRAAEGGMLVRWINELT